VKPKRQLWSYKSTNLIEDKNGINKLFKKFTEEPLRLRGKGHEAHDLHQIVGMH
jgi:hypothetical protein